MPETRPTTPSLERRTTPPTSPIIAPLPRSETRPGPQTERAQRWIVSWSRFARRPTLAVATLVAAVLVALLITTWIAGVPEPEVHDELTMLVTADVLAHGRLCEPSHPHWQHFEANYLLNEPCTQGKYPPGLPLYMAAGYLLTGQFIVGVWMSVAVMIASTAYAMYAVLSPRWALVGTLLVALRFGVAGNDRAPQLRRQWARRRRQR